jgi:hypothetical protein
MAETVTVSSEVRPSFRPSFFLWMTVVMAFFIFSGFALTYWLPMARGSLAPLPPVVHLHGLFFFSWIVLLVVQSALVNLRNVPLHRSLGTLGIGIGTGVIIVGSLITLLSVRGSIASPAPDNNTLTYLSVIAIVSFAVLFVLAIRNVRAPDNHKRLILFATINLLPPGVNRLYMVSLELSRVPLLATYLTLDALAIAILIYDWRTTRTIRLVSLVGAAFVFVPQLLHPLIVDSAAFASLSQLLASLAYYR